MPAICSARGSRSLSSTGWVRARPWLIRFLLAGCEPRVRKIAAALATLSEVSQADYQPIVAAAGLSGIVACHDRLYVYDTEAQFLAEKFNWDLRREHGITFETLAGPALHEPVYFAFGHGHLGLTFAATTGRMIAELAAGRTPSLDLRPFRIDRF